MIPDPSGKLLHMDAMLPFFQKLPFADVLFQDFLFSGIALMLWICIQFYMFPLNFMSTAYFIFGLCQTVTGFTAWKLLKKEEKNSKDT